MEAPVPVLIRNNAPFYFLMVLADTDGKPGSQLPIVECVNDTENLSLVEAQPVRGLFLIFKMCPDVERVAHV